jgi:GT2 family glycosyltransferase
MSNTGAPARNETSAAADGLLAEADRIAGRLRGAFNALASARRAIAAGHFTRARLHLARYRRRVRFDAFPLHDARASSTPAIAIVIVAYRTGADLLACVRSALAGVAPAREVIVVANGGNDDVLRALLALPVLYVRCPVNIGASEGRNAGAHFARARVIAFLDDDAVAHADFARALLSAFDDDQVHAVRGRVLPKNPAAHTQSAAHYDLGDHAIPALADTEGHSAYRASTYRDFGGMDPLLFGHEGNELSARIALRHGRGSVLYLPDAIILHDYAITAEKLSTKDERHRAMMKYLRWRRPEAVALMREYREQRERIGERGVNGNSTSNSNSNSN